MASHRDEAPSILGRHRSSLLFVALVAVIAIVAAACGGSRGEKPATTPGAPLAELPLVSATVYASPT